MPDPAAPHWLDPDAFASCLAALWVDRHGAAALNWAPLAVRLELEEVCGRAPPSGNLEKLHAAQSLLTSDDFWHDAAAFNTLCLALSGEMGDPGVWHPADVYACAWGLTEALLLAPPESDEPLSGEVRAFLGKVLDDEGLVDAPDVLRVATRGRPAAAPADYADDPGLYAGIWQSQRGRADEVTAHVRDNLRRLFAQLSALPLVHGDARGLAARLAGGPSPSR